MLRRVLGDRAANALHPPPSKPAVKAGGAPAATAATAAAAAAAAPAAGLAGMRRTAHPTVDPFRQGAAGKVLEAEASGGPAAKAKPNTPSEATAADSAGSGTGYSTFRGAAKRVDKDFAKFEQHTKGIGMKLLGKMGWKKGEGLGKAKQGITRPIEVQLRKKNAGLQDRGERTAQSREDFGNKGDSEAEEEEAFQEQLQEWRATGPRHRKRKPRLNYKTAEEIEAERGLAEEEGGAAQTLKIVDMTGPQSRVIEAREARQGASAREAARQSVYRHRDGSVPMPELQYNLNLLVEQAEHELQRSKGQLVRDEKRMRALQEDFAEMNLKLQREDHHITRLEQILDMVEQCEEAQELGLGKCLDIFRKLHQAYPKEYAAYGLATLATAAVLPLVQAALRSWDPLHEPAAHVATFQLCRPLLEIPGGSMHFDQPDQQEVRRGRGEGGGKRERERQGERGGKKSARAYVSLQGAAFTHRLYARRPRRTMRVSAASAALLTLPPPPPPPSLADRIRPARVERPRAKA